MDMRDKKFAKLYAKKKAKVLADLDKAGWGFAVAPWCREEGEELRVNGESYDETGNKPMAYDYYSEDYSTYEFGVHKDIMAIAEKHGCYWENENAAETGLVVNQ